MIRFFRFSADSNVTHLRGQKWGSPSGLPAEQAGLPLDRLWTLPACHLALRMVLTSAERGDLPPSLR
jgi:hypothetical protein